MTWHPSHPLYHDSKTTPHPGAGIKNRSSTVASTKIILAEVELENAASGVWQARKAVCKRCLSNATENNIGDIVEEYACHSCPDPPTDGKPVRPLQDAPVANGDK